MTYLYERGYPLEPRCQETIAGPNNDTFYSYYLDIVARRSRASSCRCATNTYSYSKQYSSDSTPPMHLPILSQR